MSDKHIAVVGAGPKAAAIAAKADILNRSIQSEEKIKVTIFDSCQPAANWRGSDGYTDGRARLCTAAERDLGFPYDAGIFDPNVAREMYKEYSWGAYLIDSSRDNPGRGYNDWVNRGRLPPRHSEFAAYVEWAIKKSHAEFHQERVVRIERGRDGWKLRRKTADNRNRSTGIFQGVVFTGPGAPLNLVSRGGKTTRVTDGREFWRDPQSFLNDADHSEEPVVILGAGGTAAAIAARALKSDAAREVVIIGDQAALFTRTETFFESQIFSDEDLWDRLDSSTRRDFTQRLNRGVVWATISEELSKSRRIRFEPGRAERISVSEGVDGEELHVVYKRSNKERSIPASLVIDASGFDTWWFSKLLPVDLQKRVNGKTNSETKRKRTRVTDAMKSSLILFDDKTGPIHAPMLSQAVGPGYASLMVLGAMSDRILSCYR